MFKRGFLGRRCVNRAPSSPRAGLEKWKTITFFSSLSDYVFVSSSFPTGAKRHFLLRPARHVVNSFWALFLGQSPRQKQSRRTDGLAERLAPYVLFCFSALSIIWSREKKETMDITADYQYAWHEALPAHAWGRWPEAAAWLLDQVPLTRIFGAFENAGDFNAAHYMDQYGYAKEECSERPLSTRPSTLFDLCVRTVVPFAVVKAALQAQLPMFIDVGDALDASDPAPISDPDRPWWVSVVRRFDSHPHPSVGWLEPIAACDAMRLALHHWAYLYSQQGHLPCEPWPVNDFDDGTDRGLHYAAWLAVTGNFTPLWERSPKHLVIIVRDLDMRTKCTTMVKACAIRDRAVAHGRRISHPWGQSICLYYTPWIGDDCDRLDGWIHGDPGFLIHIKC
jgi:hypothetical protein